MGARPSRPPPPELSGTLCPPPRPVWATIALACVGWLALAHGARLLGRLVLGYRQPADLSLSDAGIVIRTRTELLGRVLSDRQTVIPHAGLVRATREVRFSGLPVYVGLIALAIGSYVGVGLVVDGLRAASASLFGLGAAITLLGLGIDFLLVSVLPGVAGRCRIVLVPRRGRAACIGNVDPAAADALLAKLAQQTRSARAGSAVDEGAGPAADEAQDDAGGHPG